MEEIRTKDADNQQYKDVYQVTSWKEFGTDQADKLPDRTGKQGTMKFKAGRRHKHFRKSR